jgi:hypothetical protein
MLRGKPSPFKPPMAKIFPLITATPNAPRAVSIGVILFQEPLVLSAALAGKTWIAGRTVAPIRRMISIWVRLFIG